MLSATFLKRTNCLQGINRYWFSTCFKNSCESCICYIWCITRIAADKVQLFFVLFYRAKIGFFENKKNLPGLLRILPLALKVLKFKMKNGYVWCGRKKCYWGSFHEELCLWGEIPHPLYLHLKQIICVCVCVNEGINLLHNSHFVLSFFFFCSSSGFSSL